MSKYYDLYAKILRLPVVFERAKRVRGFAEKKLKLLATVFTHFSQLQCGRIFCFCDKKETLFSLPNFFPKSAKTKETDLEPIR